MVPRNAARLAATARVFIGSDPGRMFFGWVCPLAFLSRADPDKKQKPSERGSAAEGAERGKTHDRSPGMRRGGGAGPGGRLASGAIGADGRRSVDSGERGASVFRGAEKARPARGAVGWAGRKQVPRSGIVGGRGAMIAAARSTKQSTSARSIVRDGRKSSLPPEPF